MSEPRRRMPELETRLAELASIAGHATAPPSAEALRRLSHRRARRRQVVIGGLSLALVALIALATWRLTPHQPPLPAVTPTPSVSPGIPTHTPTPAPSASGSAGPGSTHPSVGSSAAQASAPLCSAPALSVLMGLTQGAATHRGTPLIFTNTGGHPCRLSGYPTVTALDANGRQVAQARSTPSGYMGGLTPGTQVPTVTLAAGQSASALVEALPIDASGNSCTPYATIVVSTPNDTASARLTWNNDGCSGLEVHPIVPGTTGRGG